MEIEVKRRVMAHAEKAVRTYPTQDEFTVSDLIVDLLHYAAINGADIELLLDRVRMHFEAEQQGEY